MISFLNHEGTPMHETTGFDANLRAARARANLNQTQLARLCGYGQTNVSKWERGQSTPTVDQLLVIAQALGTTAAALVSNLKGPPERLPSQGRATTQAKASPLKRHGTRTTSSQEPPLVTRRARRQPPSEAA